MKNLIYILPAALFFGCSDKNEDTGDTATETAEDTSAEDTD
tara:strand:+ start:244 stop:366 length:123 start_codon:yes stop_codon:yes gene_type:complete